MRGRPDPERWVAATRAWRDLAMPFHAAYTVFREGEAVFAATGDRDAAADRIAEARDVAESLGAVTLLDVVDAFARRARIGRRNDHDDTFGLTPREHEVLEVLATGATNRQIAELLFISEKTASVHVSNILRKLGVTNRGEAASFALRAGLAG